MNAIGSKHLRDNVNEKYLWHLRLGHVAEDKINRLKKIGLLSLLTSESYSVCESYLQDKMTKLSFVRLGERIIE